MAAKKQIKYTEPAGYFPKEIREKYFGDSRKAPAKKSGAKSTGSKSKGKK